MYVGVELEDRATELRLLLEKDASLQSSCTTCWPVSFLCILWDGWFLLFLSTINCRMFFCGFRSFHGRQLFLINRMTIHLDNRQYIKYQIIKKVDLVIATWSILSPTSRILSAGPPDIISVTLNMLSQSYRKPRPASIKKTKKLVKSRSM